jgi:hypothetical protein
MNPPAGHDVVFLNYDTPIAAERTCASLRSKKPVNTTASAATARAA